MFATPFPSRYGVIRPLFWWAAPLSGASIAAGFRSGLWGRRWGRAGLRGGDVRAAFCEPVWRDPTAVLVSRAHERRINRRRLRIGLVEKSFEAPSIVPPPRATRAAVDARYY